MTRFTSAGFFFPYGGSSRLKNNTVGGVLLLLCPYLRSLIRIMTLLYSNESMTPEYLLHDSVFALRYVPPDQAKVVASVHASMSGSSASSTNSTPEVRPLKTLLGDSAPALHLNRNTPSQVREHTHTREIPDTRVLLLHQP